MRDINDVSIMFFGFRLSANSVLIQINMHLLQAVLAEENDLQDALVFFNEFKKECSKVSELILNEKIKDNSDLEKLLNSSIYGHQSLIALKKEVVNRCKENKDLDRTTIMEILNILIETFKDLSDELKEFF